MINSEPTPTGLEAFYSHNRSARALSTWSYSTGTKKCLLTVLLLGGDIRLNPGPNWKYPCGTCNKPVKRSQKGIQCDHCDLWYHTKRCSIGDEIYNILANSSCVWLCPSCGLPSFSDSLPEASLDTQNSFSSLESLTLKLSFPTSPSSGTNNGTSNGSSNGTSNGTSNRTSNGTSNRTQQQQQPPSFKSTKVSRQKNKIRGMILNCNGLKGSDHIAKFQALLDLHNPDFVLGTESKLCSNISSYSIFPPNYTVFRKDRNRFGGGIFQAIKSDLICVEEFDFAVDDCEIIWTSLKLANCKTLFLSSYYRPPNSSSDSLDHLSESIRQVFAKVPNHPNIIIGGDFNLGDIDWDTPVPTPNNPSTASRHQKFLQIIDDYSLSQHVKASTRPISGKVLDLLLATYPNAIGDTSNVSGLSDHLAVIFEVNLKPTRSVKPPHKVYLYNKANFDGLREFMSDSSSAFFCIKT